jgi:hypothetical protein
MSVGMYALLEPGIENYIAVAAIEVLCFARIDVLLRAFVTADIFTRCPIS